MSALSVEVECLEYFFFCGRLVDADVSDTSKQREVDDARGVLLVVSHELEEIGVVVAGDGHLTIVLFDEADRLPHLVRRESCLDSTQVELAYQAPGNGIAMEYRLMSEGERLKA